MGRISANPDTFTEGGLIDNFDGVIIEARTNLFTYPGGNTEVPAIRLLIGYGDGDAERYEQQYSAGDMKNFVPSEDNLFFDQVGDRGYLVKTSNAGMLLASLVNSGFPKAQLDAGDYSVLDGTRCHFLREVQKERAGIANPEESADGKKKGPRTILLVSEVKALPGGKPATAAKTTTVKKPGPVAVPAKPTASAPAPAAAAAPAAGGKEPTDDNLGEFLLEKLMETNEAGDLVRPDGIKKKELLPLVFNAFKTDAPMRNFGSKRVVQPEFLTALAGVEFVDDVLRMAS